MPQVANREGQEAQNRHITQPPCKGPKDAMLSGGGCLCDTMVSGTCETHFLTPSPRLLSSQGSELAWERKHRPRREAQSLGRSRWSQALPCEEVWAGVSPPVTLLLAQMWPGSGERLR